MAAAFAARCAARGVDPDPSLRILGHDDGRPPHDPDRRRSLGELHEGLVAGEEQVARGAWYTPAWLAADLVARAVVGPGVVADPACGGGVFLLAAARRLRASGESPERIVAELLVGVDIDRLAVAVCEAELWSWSVAEGRPTVPGRLWVGDALTDVELPSVDAVVGNPPFLGQLKAGTAFDAERRHRLTERWGAVVRAYTDSAWLFLLAAVDGVAPGGRVAMIQPQSLLAARDAAGVRSRVGALATLEDCWVDDGTAFDASVRVCAPVLRRNDPASGCVDDRARGRSWVDPILDANGIPTTVATGTRTVGDLATPVAGFRDEYYGLVEHVRDGGDGPRLVTSGSIDPFRLRPGPVRFAKQRWARPTVDTGSLAGRAQQWAAAQRGPKLVVASQTKILEAVVDVDGALLAGVPAIVVPPNDEADLWRLAAALHAPCVSAWMLRHTIGTGLTAGACRPTAALVGRIPLPDDPDTWEEAARLAARVAGGEDRFEDFAAAADGAYGVDDEALRSWWLARLRVP